MSKTYSYVDASGRFTGKTTSTSASGERLRQFLKAKARDGMTLKEGRYDHTRQRVDLQTGLVIDDEQMQTQTAQAQERRRRRANALTRIQALELKQLRPMRELAIDPTNEHAKQRLQAIEAEIAEQRGGLSNAG